MKIFSILLVSLMFRSYLCKISDHNFGNFMKFLQVMKLNEWATKEKIPRDVFQDYLAQIQKESIKQRTRKYKYRGTCIILALDNSM